MRIHRRRHDLRLALGIEPDQRHVLALGLGFLDRQARERPPRSRRPVDAARLGQVLAPCAAAVGLVHAREERGDHLAQLGEHRVAVGADLRQGVRRACAAAGSRRTAPSRTCRRACAPRPASRPRSVSHAFARIVARYTPSESAGSCGKRSRKYACSGLEPPGVRVEGQVARLAEPARPGRPRRPPAARGSGTGRRAGRRTGRSAWTARGRRPAGPARAPWSGSARPARRPGARRRAAPPSRRRTRRTPARTAARPARRPRSPPTARPWPRPRSPAPSPRNSSRNSRRSVFDVRE